MNKLFVVTLECSSDDGEQLFRVADWEGDIAESQTVWCDTGVALEVNMVSHFVFYKDYLPHTEIDLGDVAEFEFVRLRDSGWSPVNPMIIKE